MYNLGIYKDNSLTYKIRFQEEDSFNYLLGRGISVLGADQNGNNVIHHTVLMEKPSFLVYLFEGSFESEIMQMCKDQ